MEVTTPGERNGTMGSRAGSMGLIVSMMMRTSLETAVS